MIDIVTWGGRFECPCYFVIMLFPASRKKVLSEATEMYPRRITRPCKQKTDARIDIRVLRRIRGERIVAKVTVCAAELQVGMRTCTQICPNPFSENATQRATRAKLRAKNGRGVRHRSHLKQFKCAVGFFNDDVRQGTMRALRRLGL